jgi:hypothetical protein
MKLNEKKNEEQLKTAGKGNVPFEPTVKTI